MMKIWHITPYDTIPGEIWRPGRAITMCKILSSHGHQVIWWTSNYSHFFKCHRSAGWKDIEVSPNLRIRLVPVPGYQAHFSLARLRFHLAYAWRLYFRALNDSPPDYIILALPTPGADFVATRLAKKFGAKLIVDVRDLWPELFMLAFPPALQRFIHIMLYPFYALRRYALQNADMVTAVTKTYLEVALKDAPHLRNTKKSRVIHFGADVQVLHNLINQSNLDNQIYKEPGEVWAIYAGTLGEMYDIQTILDAAILLRKSEAKVKILIAGSGPLRDKVIDFKKLYKLDNIIYLGVLSFNDLARHYSVSDIGLSTYFKKSTVVMPAKVYDYLAAGLPIVNSLSGELEELLHETNTGVQYTPGNAKSLAFILKQLAEDATKRSFLSQNAYNVALRFERQTSYLRFLDLLK